MNIEMFFQKETDHEFYLTLNSNEKLDKNVYAKENSTTVSKKKRLWQ